MNSTRPETTKPLRTCRSSSFPLGTFSGTKNLLNHNFPNLLNILIVLIPSVTSTRRPFPTGAWTTSLGTTTLARTPKGKIRCLRCCKRSCSRTIQGVESGVCNILFFYYFSFVLLLCSRLSCSFNRSEIIFLSKERGNSFCSLCLPYLLQCNKLSRYLAFQYFLCSLFSSYLQQSTSQRDRLLPRWDCNEMSNEVHPLIQIGMVVWENYK